MPVKAQKPHNATNTNCYTTEKGLSFRRVLVGGLVAQGGENQPAPWWSWMVLFMSCAESVKKEVKLFQNVFQMCSCV